MLTNKMYEVRIKDLQSATPLIYQGLEELEFVMDSPEEVSRRKS